MRVRFVLLYTHTHTHTRYHILYGKRDDSCANERGAARVLCRREFDVCRSSIVLLLRVSYEDRVVFRTHKTARTVRHSCRYERGRALARGPNGAE